MNSKMKTFLFFLLTGCSIMQSGEEMTQELQCSNSSKVEVIGTILKVEEKDLIDGTSAMSYATVIDIMELKSPNCEGDMVTVILAAGNPGYLRPGKQIKVFIENANKPTSSISNWESL